MSEQFYLYGTFNEGSDTLSNTHFSFVVEEERRLTTPSFLIWFFRDTDSEALLCKIRKTTKPADIGMTVYVYDALRIRLISHGVVNSVYADVRQSTGMSGREFVGEMMQMRGFWSVPEEKSALVKNAILKSNVGVLDESYFMLGESSIDSEIEVELSDAIHTAFKIFGMSSQGLPSLREQQILDFDIQTIFDDASKLCSTPDGKHLFEHNGRKLYLHKVDRTKIEEVLGVDLIYNFLDERRLVFVQYKCQKPQGKYYPASDASHDSEVDRMCSIPGLNECSNMMQVDEKSARLCQCPVFIKLCKREVSYAHSVPVGAYFPLCVWRCLTANHAGLTVKNDPHFNNHQFQELVKTGLIGSSQSQADEISKHLVEHANDSRLKLIFEETSV